MRDSARPVEHAKVGRILASDAMRFGDIIYGFLIFWGVSTAIKTLRSDFSMHHPRPSLENGEGGSLEGESGVDRVTPTTTL